MEYFRYEKALGEFFAHLVNFVCNDLAGKHFALISSSWDQEDKRRREKMKKLKRDCIRVISKNAGPSLSTLTYEWGIIDICLWPFFEIYFTFQENTRNQHFPISRHERNRGGYGNDR